MKEIIKESMNYLNSIAPVIYCFAVVILMSISFFIFGIKSKNRGVSP